MIKDHSRYETFGQEMVLFSLGEISLGYYRNNRKGTAGSLSLPHVWRILNVLLCWRGNEVSHVCQKTQKDERTFLAAWLLWWPS